jgi:hypothetical protein
VNAETVRTEALALQGIKGMATGNLVKIKARTAAEICENLELDEESQKLLTPALTPGEFLDALMAQELWIDACRFLALALPKREAVWWALLCAKTDPAPTPPATAALQLAEKWVLETSEENRQPGQAAAEAAGLGTPAGLTALAVFVSGGSMAPPEVSQVPPAEHLTGTVVGNALIMAALLPTPAEADGKFRQFLATGIEVAQGTNRWKEPTAPAAATKTAARPAAPTR